MEVLQLPRLYVVARLETMYAVLFEAQEPWQIVPSCFFGVRYVLGEGMEERGEGEVLRISTDRVGEGQVEVVDVLVLVEVEVDEFVVDEERTVVNVIEERIIDVV